MANKLKLGEIFLPEPGYIKQTFLDDIELGYYDYNQQLALTNPNQAPVIAPIQYGTPLYITASALDLYAGLISKNVSLAYSKASPLYATGQDLEDIRISRGLPEKIPTKSTGQVQVKISGSGTANFVDGLLLNLNGMQFQVNGTQPLVANNDNINIVSISTGLQTNLKTNTKIKFENPPVNVKVDATVIAPGFTGGSDGETDDEKRERILNSYRFPKNAGTPQYCNELAETSALVQKAFAYPALGGPATAKIVVQKSMNIDVDDFDKAIGDYQLGEISSYVVGNLPGFAEIMVQSIAMEDTNIVLNMTLQSINSSGGAGNSWENVIQFPIPSGNFVPVNTVVSTVNITILKSDTDGVAPVAYSSIIAHWSGNSIYKQFTKSLITAVVDGGTYWDITLATPLTDVSVGDYISPASKNIDSYRDTWLKQMNLLGPGENSNRTNVFDSYKLRGFRFPQPNVGGYQYNLNSVQTRNLLDTHNEILNVDYKYTSKSTPTISDENDAPYVLGLKHFAIYPEVN